MQLDRGIKHGILYGLLATLAMTLVMLTGMATGLAPMPEPIPKALAELMLGWVLGSISAPVLMVTGMLAHFGYGALAGVMFVILFAEKASWKTGLIWGGILWLIMQVAVLPLLGWGVFGLTVTGFPPKIAVGTLVLHMIYGIIVGWGVNYE